MCEREGGNPGDPALRAAHRCSLPDFDRSRWVGPVASAAEHAADELVGIARSQGLELGFDLEQDGCPWGWATSRFATEVSSYMGTRGADSPIRSESLRLQRRMMRDDDEPIGLFWLARRAENWEDSAYSYYRGRLSSG